MVHTMLRSNPECVVFNFIEVNAIESHSITTHLYLWMESSQWLLPHRLSPNHHQTIYQECCFNITTAMKVQEQKHLRTTSMPEESGGTLSGQQQEQ